MRDAPFARLSARARAGAAALAGGAMALAQPPLGLWPAFFIAGPILYLLWLAAGAAPRPGRAAFITGWAAGAAHFALALHWIVEPFLVDAARHGWMAPFALLGLCGGLALFWGAGFWLAWRLRRLVAGPLALAAAWAAAEFARSCVLTGFPWALPVYGWMETPLAQAGALIGPYGLSFLTLAAMLAPGALLVRPRAAAPALLTLPALAGLWIWGAARVPAETADAARPLIRILQTDVDQASKWDPERVKPGFDRLIALSTAPAETPPAVIVWPESAITFPIDMAPTARAAIHAALGDSALALGSLRADAGPDAPVKIGARWRNSLFLLEEDAISPPYDKVHLVPFGEYLPFSALFTRIGLSELAGPGGGIVAGARHVSMRPEAAPPFAPLICYEMIFPRETARAAKGADWLILVTNDAWFGNWAGPAQHLAMARMRAIETGLPVARSANRGWSAMIDPYGRAIGRIGLGRDGVIDARLPDSPEAPPYFEQGELITTFMICAALLFSTQSRRRDDS
ncbi:apolipoprotein N-acyltransferase [Pikeienuella sp. HZG-20]|uniref:apolipoprotein N-acyltransferase n=1 Tax=Paludibacillus litoralis TaxID=3133267 RepID=UPI0030EE6771